MDNNNRISNSVRNALYGSIKYIVLFIFPFIFRTVIIYRFGVEYSGITSLFSSILQVLSLSELGFSTVVIYVMYEPVAKNQYDRVCSLLAFYRRVYHIIGTVILILGLLLCPFIELLISGTYPNEINIYVIFIILLFNSAVSYLFCGYKSTLFAVYQRDDITSKTQLIANLLMYLFQFIALFSLKNYYAYILCMLIGTLFNNFLMHYFSKKMFPNICCKGEISKNEKKQLLKKVSTLFGHQLDVVIITSADNIVISSFLGLKSLTIYGNYYTIVNALLGMITMIANSFLASIGNSIAIEDKEKNYKNFIDFVYLIINLAGITTILMFVLFQDFMKLWMGEELLLENSIVFLMCLSFYVRLLKRPANMYKEACGLWDIDALKPYVAGISNLILNIFLVKYIGLYGVILSTIFSLAIIEKPWESYVLFKHYFEFGYGRYLRVRVITAIKLFIIGGIAYLISSYIEANNFFFFFIKACIVGISVVGMFILFSYKDAQFKYIVRNIKKIINKNKGEK